jgi:hypothetical protein
MIPCRLLPLYQIFETYRKSGQKEMAEKYSTEIINKKVKIPSMTVSSIKAEEEKYCKHSALYRLSVNLATFTLGEEPPR